MPLSLLLLAIAEMLAANQLRDRIRRRPGALPVQPLVAARMLALAKASSVVGAVMLGIWAGLLVYACPGSESWRPPAMTPPSASSVCSPRSRSTAAALWLEYSLPNTGTAERRSAT